MTRDEEIAMVFLGTHGSTTYPPETWQGYKYAVTDYAPEWLTEVDSDECVTVLDFSLATRIEAPAGYQIAYQGSAGEQSCPWCGDGTGEEHQRPDCKLCDGDGLLYWGEECQVVVFSPS